MFGAKRAWRTFCQLTASMKTVHSLVSRARPGCCQKARGLFVIPAAVLALWLGAVPALAQGDRFGEPWMDKVTADSTTVYTQPDKSSAPVGPLSKDAVVIATAQQGDWIQTTLGWVPSSDVTETVDPWVGEVTPDSVSVYAYPNTSMGVRITASKGHLLLVEGVSPGVGGDGNLWWATNEGYVDVGSLQQATSDWAKQWKMPSASDATNGWWGQASAANVRAGPTTDAPVVGAFSGGEHVKVLEEKQGQDIQGSATWYRIDGGRYAGAWVHSSLIQKIDQPQPTVAPPPGDVGDQPWIVVNRSSHTLTLLRNGQPQFATYVALGEAGVQTPTGDYSTWGKYRADRMSSGANPEATHPYDLPNVPFVQYYKDGGYAIHGTYWHDLFGTNQSQGCINLTWADSAYLFDQTLPKVASDGSGGGEQQAAQNQPATPVVILD